jgi:hypothetical protein
MVPGELPRHLRRGRQERKGPRRLMARGGRAAHLPPKGLAGPVALAARHRVTKCAAPRPRPAVTGPAGRPVRRTRARRAQVRLMAGHAQAGALRVPPPMTMSGMAAGGLRPAPSSAARARAGLRPPVSSAAVRGPRQMALRATGPGPRGRTGPGRRARGTASVTAAGPLIATSGVMRAVRLPAVVRGVQAATTAPQRATGRVVPVAGMAPHMTAASVLTTGTRPVTGVPPVTVVPVRILPLTGLPVAGRRDRIRVPIGLPVTVVRDRTPPLTGPPVAGRPGRIRVPIGLPVTVVRDRTPPLTGPPVPGRPGRTRVPIGLPAGAVRTAARPGLPATGPGTARRDVTLDRWTEAAPEAR